VLTDWKSSKNHTGKIKRPAHQFDGQGVKENAEEYFY